MDTVPGRSEMTRSLKVRPQVGVQIIILCSAVPSTDLLDDLIGMSSFVRPSQSELWTLKSPAKSR